MQKIYNYVFLSSVVLIAILISSSSVFATDINEKNSFSPDSDIVLNLSDSSVVDNSDEGNNLYADSYSNEYFAAEYSESCDDSLIESNSKNLEDSSINANSNDWRGSDNFNDASIDSVHYVGCDNFTHYFVNGVLKEEFEGSVLILNGEFVDMDVITISSPNVAIIGNESLLNNTVFRLESSNILLTGLNFVLDKEFASNDYAGILVRGNNCTVFNCSIDYFVPEATNGFCVYADGNGEEKIKNFTLANNVFNFIGNNLGGGWDYCIFTDQTENTVIYGNTINCSLPLRSVDWSFNIFGGVSMDAVAVIAAQGSDYLTLSNNNIYSYVSGGGTSYPTLDTVILYDCNNTVVEGNIIYCEDFDSKDGKDNYLQGIDVYFANNVTILDNQIHIRTTGGRAGMGTAYPIQVNGPSYDVKIAYNNLSTISFGPNIGIYSQNYYGSTRIDIISNFINVTGLASTHYWALVAGIEVQDSDDLIWNNTIIVTNIGNYSANDNIYGISYSQNTQGNHTYDIQYNNVTTNGRYAVSLSGTNSLVVNSIVANNVLNTNAVNGNRAVRIGQGHNNTIRNNTDGRFVNTLDADDLPDWLKNHKSIVLHIVVPKYHGEDSNGSGLTDSEGNGTALWNNSGSQGGINNGNGSNRNNDISGNGTDSNSDNVIGSNQDADLDIGGESSSSNSAAGIGDSGSSATDTDAYEIDKNASIVNKSVNLVLMACVFIIVLLLIFAGYYHQKNNEE